MSLPELPKDPPRPGVWAERVPRDEPDLLALLEAHAFAYATGADELSKTPKWRIAWGVAPLFLSVLPSIGGFAALFGNPEHIRRGWTDEPDATAIPWASLSYSVAVIGVVVILAHWFLQGRRRNGALQFCLVWTFVFGALGIPVGSGLAAEAGVSLGLTMLPACLMMALAVIVFVIIQVSPRPDPEPEKPLLSIEQLDEKAMRYLMSERSHALDTLWKRHLLPGVDRKALKALKARPLGTLHIQDDVEAS